MRGTIHTCIIIYLVSMILLYAITPLTAETDQTIIYATPQDDLQDIIDDAPPYSILSLASGIYTQELVIHIPIHIKGSLDDTTVFIVETGTNKPALSISSEQTILQDLTIINTGPGIYTTGVRVIADYSTIHRCHFKDTPVGIAFWSSNNIVAHSTFFNCSDEGIVIISSSLFTANNNTIEHCRFIKNCDGIELQQSSYNTIKNCLFDGNTHDGISGIKSNNDHNRILNCTVINNQVHGVYFSRSYNNTIQDCIIENNTDAEVLFTPDLNDNVVHYTTNNNSKQPLPPANTLEERKTDHTRRSNFLNTIRDRLLALLTPLIGFIRISGLTLQSSIPI
ncbi:MAG: right-handed parallel beta-helix repeat-containing protein [Candidatus Thermoplasmatota archaeon]|nr:right-handed parallel beta-helix repeat-containing protein [Candidatus Thermoplasmatota archaeon]